MIVIIDSGTRSELFSDRPAGKQHKLCHGVVF